MSEDHALLKTVAKTLKCKKEEVPEKVKKLVKEVELEQKIFLRLEYLYKHNIAGWQDEELQNLLKSKN